MMLLDPNIVEGGSALISVGTFLMVMRLTFAAGGIVRQVETNTKRLDILEKAKCPHPECPLLRLGIQQLETEREG